MAADDPSGYAHADEVAGASSAAAVVVPAVLATTGPVGSVVDVGGGTGAWLREFARRGVARVLLVDAPAAVARPLVDPSQVRAADLNTEFPLVGRFDLAVCVECAEHLRPARGPELVEYLSGLADRVLFSAAVPGQGGKGHVNLRDHSYWTALFAARGLARADVVRPAILWAADLPYWYRQNLSLYARPGTLPSDGRGFLPDEFELRHRDVLAALETPGLAAAARGLRAALAKTVGRRLGRRRR